MRKRRLFGIFILAAAMTCQPGKLVAAQSPGSEDARPLIPHVHTRWLVKDGVPPSIRGIAQTPDGWLWLASSVGLFRFDGVKFTQYRQPGSAAMQGAVDKLGVLDDGTLWVSPRFGGLLLVRGDVVEEFGGKQGLPPMVIGAVAGDSAGRILLGNGKGIFQLDARSRRWHEIGERAGLPKGSSIRHMLRDLRGGLWVLCTTTMVDSIALNEYLFDRKGNIWFPQLNSLMREQREGKQAVLEAFSNR
ncbi:ligand-binding sensor domain-containing protein [Massilia niabensis]|uniref:Uncharacterized protein n=1 Tax=Massilia niabensis TaxID=544910 RepID=A0ABW0L4X8_9BURK